jgi:integrase
MAYAAALFEREYEAITEGQRNPRRVAMHKMRLRVHLVPFFGTMGLSEITPGKLQEYRIHRRQEAVATRGKPPSRSTIHQEIVALRLTLKAANRNGWLQYLPDLSEPYKASGKVSHRAWFSPEEYKQLYTATRKRALHPKNPRFKWEAEQLHDYVLLMVNTGLRPDEAARLQFRDVTIVEDESLGETILEIVVRGKRGVGYCKSMPGAVRPFERIRDRPRKPVYAGTEKAKLPGPTDLLFPISHREMLNAILDEEDLKEDREGQRRTAYSLRHTYICLRLIEDADIYQIAKNCRTSVEMIEKFYARPTSRRASTPPRSTCAARRRPRPRRRPNEPRVREGCAWR